MKRSCVSICQTDAVGTKTLQRRLLRILDMKNPKTRVKKASEAAAETLRSLGYGAGATLLLRCFEVQDVPSKEELSAYCKDRHRCSKGAKPKTLCEIFAEGV